MEQPSVPVVQKPRGPLTGAALLVLAAFVAVGGVTFAAGRLTAPTASAASRTGFTAGGSGGQSAAGGFGSFAGGLGGGLTIRGTVVNVSTNGLTITLSSGTTITIPTDASTTYHQQAAGSPSDVQAGRQVLVELSGGLRGSANGGPNASPSPGQSPTLRPASDVTVIGR